MTGDWRKPDDKAHVEKKLLSLRFEKCREGTQKFNMPTWFREDKGKTKGNIIEKIQ